MCVGANGVVVQADYCQPRSIIESRPQRHPLIPFNQQHPVTIHFNPEKAHILFRSTNAPRSLKPSEKNLPAPGHQPPGVNSPTKTLTSATVQSFLKVFTIAKHLRNFPSNAF